MGNGISADYKSSTNPYIFFPINTHNGSIKNKIDQTLQYMNFSSRICPFQALRLK